MNSSFLARAGIARACRRVAAVLVLSVAAPLAAHAALTVTPLTWDIVGLDSNSPLTGPQHFPVGARVCSDVATTSVVVNYVWESTNAFINLRPGSLSTITFPTLAAGACADAYFEVEITRDAAAFDTVRRYRIAATDPTGTYPSPVPRQIYVEHLVSQSRNSITNLRYGPDAGNLVAVAEGGSLDLVVGQTYVIELSGATATQGYEQLEAFINFTNTIFRITNVVTTYSADTSPIVPSPNDRLYANACGWENDPNSPNYRSCLGDGKAGGTIVTQYTITIIGGGGTQQTLNTLVHDFSGSSYHYNADFGAGARFANIVDPTLAGIAKSFAPNPSTQNGVSVLTFSLTNPNTGALAGYNFVDNLPANMTIASPTGATTSGCGTPTLTAPAGGTSISFSNGTVGANGTCTISVNVTTSTTGSFVNTTQNLFIGATNTGKTATATLTVNNDPPPGTGLCGQSLATWRFPVGFNVNAPAPSTSTVAASAAPGAGIVPNTQTTITADGTSAWGSNGSITNVPALVTLNNDYFEFAVNTTGLASVQFSFDARRTNNGPRGVALFYGTTNTRPETGTQVFSNPTALPTTTAVSFSGGPITTGLNPAGSTFFRVYFFAPNNDNPGSDPTIDNVVAAACGAGIKPTLTKSFAPDPIAVNAASTLTFTLTNTNAAPLTGASFTDALPAGVQVAATPAATTTCAAAVWAPAAGATTLTFSGGTIPASASCTASVNVTATTPGTKTNVSGFLVTTETGTTTTSVATDTLTALSPPAIAKQFEPNPILAPGVTTLTFTITNPNGANAISGVAFSDTFPVAPGAMQVAPAPNATLSGCGAPTFAPIAGAGSISFTGGTIAAGGTCIVTVDVRAPVAGSYANTTSPVSHVINAVSVNGNTAGDTLVATAPNPSINLLKQVSLSAAGPWFSFQAVNLPGDVFYRFTIENTGDVPLSPVSVSDALVPGAAGCAWPGTLPVADALDNDHIATCVVGPIAASAGTRINTATASGTFGGTTVTDTDSATYASAALTIAKSASPTTYTAAGNVITYSFLVTNSGAATLSGPITVLDDRTTNETCPALSTIGDLDNFFDPGEQLTCSATYTITAADVAAASVVNTASATNGSTTSPPASATVTLAGPRLSVTKGASPIPFAVGLPASYTITVTNNGSASTSSNFTITDNLPAGITLASASGTNWSCTGTTNLSCTFTGTLTAAPAAGSSTTLTLNVNVGAGATNANNSATVSGGGDPTCPAAAACTGTVTVGVVSPVLGTTKSGVLDNSVVAPSNQSNPGDRITYTITVANTGTGPATGVSISDPRLPSLTCTIGASPAAMPTTLNAGASLVCTGTYTLVAGDVATGSVTNTATTTGANVCNPTTAGSTCSATAVVPLGVVPVLTTTKAATLDNTVVPPSNQSNPGDTIAYTITVSNAGNAPANGVSVSDPRLPSLSCTPVLPATINPGASLVCTGTYVLTAGDVATGSVSNTATVSGSNVCNPTTAGSTCSDSRTTPLALSPVLTTTKVGSANNAVVAPASQSNPGDTIAYTITVANSGNGTATGVGVSDPRIAALSCTIGGGAVTLPTSLAAGASLVCTGSYTLTAGDVTTGSVFNTATVTGTNVCNPTTTGSTCSASATTPLALEAVLSITKAATLDNTVVAPSTESNPGDRIAYTLTVVNSGNGAATGVSVADPRLAAVSCTIGGSAVTQPATLDAGASLVCTGNYTLTATDVGNGSVLNTATVSGGNVCNPTTAGSTCSDSETTPLAVAPILTTAKTSTLDNAVVNPSNESNPGDRITYTISVANSGNGAATGVTISDPRLATISCTIGGGAVTLPVTLAAGATLVCVGDYTLTTGDVSTGSVSNTATTTATNVCNPTTAGSTCSDTRVTPLGVVPALTLVKSAVLDNTVVAPSSQSNPGDRIAYTITVSNSGNAAANGVTVSDPRLPSPSCTIGGAAVSQPATLAAGASLVCTGTYTLVQADVSAGAVSNTASVAATNVCNPTTVGSTCSDTVSTPLAVAPILTTTKSSIRVDSVVAPANRSDVGDRIDYTITVANSGNGTASSVSVSDARLASLSCTVGGSAVSQPATLAPGASLVCTGSYTLAAGDVSNGSVVNTATATAENVCNPSTAGSTCSSTVTTPLALTPSLALTKVGTIDNSVVAPSNQSNVGDRIAYTITVSNSGNGAATGVSVADARLPTLSCTIGGAAVSQPVTLNAGASLVCTGTYTLTAADVSNGSVANTATVTASNVCNPTTAGSTCSDTRTTPLALAPVLTTSKSGTLDNTVVAPSNESNAGDRIAYTITVANSGNGAATGVTVSDARVPSLSCRIGAGAVSMPATLNAGASLVCTGTYTLTTADVATGSVTNTATVSGTNVCNPTSAGSTCADTQTTPLGQVPNLTVDKSHVGDFVQGQVGATYTIAIRNVGSGPTAGTVTLTDTLPTGLTATAITGASWSCTLATLTCTRSDVLAAGGSYPVIVLTVNVANNAPATLVNTATVSGGGDTTPGNNTDADPATVGEAGLGTSPDLMLVKSHVGTFVRGESGTYTLVVSNIGTAPTSGLVTVADTLPSGLSATAISGAGWTCTLATLTCTRSDSLAIRASYPAITLIVAVATNAPADVVNTATVSGGGDTTPPNNTGTDPTPVGVGAPTPVPVDAPWALLLLAAALLLFTARRRDFGAR